MNRPSLIIKDDESDESFVKYDGPLEDDRASLILKNQLKSQGQDTIK